MVQTNNAKKVYFCVDMKLNILILQIVAVALIMALAVGIRLFGGDVYDKLSIWYHEKFDDITLASDVLEPENSLPNNLGNDTNSAVIDEFDKSESFLDSLYEDDDDDINSGVEGNITQLDNSSATLTVGNNVNTFSWPVSGEVSSGYGYRIHPITGEYAMHNGIDIASEKGNPIIAAYDGMVSSTGYSNSYGYYVIINHGENIQTLYAHCSKVLVEKGDVIKKEDKIALVGSTGRSTGPHVHFEVRIDGYRVNPEWLLSNVSEV